MENHTEWSIAKSSESAHKQVTQCGAILSTHLTLKEIQQKMKELQIIKSKYCFIVTIVCKKKKLRFCIRYVSEIHLYQLHCYVCFY